MTKFVSGIVAFSALALVACGSSPVLRSATSDKDLQGYSKLGSYYLPEKMVIVSAKFDGNGNFVRPAPTENIGFIEIIAPGKMMLIGNSSSNDYDEKIKIETTNGYLTRVSTDVTDKRPEALTTITTEIPNISDGNKPPAAAASESTSRRKDLIIRHLLDPLNASEVNTFNTIYGKHGICLRITKIGQDPDGISISTHIDGIVVPVLTARRMEIQLLRDNEDDCTTTTGDQLFASTITLPKRGLFASIDIDRTAWVQHKVDVTFDNGTFKSMDFYRGSATASVARLPVSVLKALISIPAEIVQLRVNQSGQSKRELDAMKAEVDAKVALMKAQAALDAERKKQNDTNAPAQ